MNKRFSKNTKTWRKSTIEDFEEVQGGGLRDIHIGDVLDFDQAERAIYSIDEETGEIWRDFRPAPDWERIDQEIKWLKENF